MEKVTLEQLLTTWNSTHIKLRIDKSSLAIYREGYFISMPLENIENIGYHTDVAYSIQTDTCSITLFKNINELIITNYTNHNEKNQRTPL